MHVRSNINFAKPHGEPTDVDDFALQTAPTSEVDVESIASSVSTESLASNSHISVGEISSADSDDSIQEDADDPEYDKRTILVEGKPPQDQIKFIVFEQASLDVFGQCVRRGSKCVAKFASRAQATVSITSRVQVVRASSKWQHSTFC